MLQCSFMQFSTKLDGFEQKDSQGFENTYNSYEQYPLEKFFIFTIYQNYTLALIYTALIWQKEASDKSDISRKRAKCVCHLHWRQWNIRMSHLTYLLVGWVFRHEIWPGRRAYYVNYENINNSNLDGMSLASFCQSRAVYSEHFFGASCLLTLSARITV